MSILGGLTKALIGVAVLPLDAVADIITLGGVNTNQQSTYTGKRAAAIMASAMPVLPLVASINLTDRSSSPRCSAPRIIARAGRSLTLPPGLLPSSLPNSRMPGRDTSVASSIMGVLPTTSSIRVCCVPISLAALPFTGYVTFPCEESPASLKRSKP